MAEEIRDGDAPAIVAKAIVAAATDARPKLRCTAGPMAGHASTAPSRSSPGLRLPELRCGPERNMNATPEPAA